MITILKREDITDRLVFEARDYDEVIGSISCRIEKDMLYIDGIKSVPFLVDGLMRTAMNYALNRFVNKCTVNPLDDSVMEQLQKLGFVQNNNNTIDDIDNFFTFHKSCKK